MENLLTCLFVRWLQKRSADAGGGARVAAGTRVKREAGPGSCPELDTSLLTLTLVPRPGAGPPPGHAYNALGATVRAACSPRHTLPPATTTRLALQLTSY